MVTDQPYLHGLTDRRRKRARPAARGASLGHQPRARTGRWEAGAVRADPAVVASAGELQGLVPSLLLCGRAMRVRRGGHPARRGGGSGLGMTAAVGLRTPLTHAVPAARPVQLSSSARSVQWRVCGQPTPVATACAAAAVSGVSAAAWAASQPLQARPDLCTAPRGSSRRPAGPGAPARSASLQTRLSQAPAHFAGALVDVAEVDPSDEELMCIDWRGGEDDVGALAVPEDSFVTVRRWPKTTACLPRPPGPPSRTGRRADEPARSAHRASAARSVRRPRHLRETP